MYKQFVSNFLTELTFMAAWLPSYIRVNVDFLPNDLIQLEHIMVGIPKSAQLGSRLWAKS